VAPLSRHSVRCRHCGLPLLGRHARPNRPCPRCGSIERHVIACVNETVTIRDGQLWRRWREFYEKNSLILAVLVFIAVGSPLLGLLLAGPLAALIGVVLGILSLALGPLAVTKVRDVARGN